MPICYPSNMRITLHIDQQILPIHFSTNELHQSQHCRDTRMGIYHYAMANRRMGICFFPGQVKLMFSLN